MSAAGRRPLRGLLTAGLLAFASLNANSQSPASDIRTNENEIASALRSSPLNIDDKTAVLAFVLGQLPDRVKVYPTENYYYFSFIHDGIAYEGNIRLPVVNRDKGEVSFAYSERFSDWLEEPVNRYGMLGAGQGVTVEKLAPLAYRVAAGGRSVTFELNDVSAIVPPAGLLRPDEKYIGPVFDESAIRFFLVFNERLKVFHYLLDETEKVADGFVSGADRIQIGKRTGFAFYRDGDRKVLVGVSGPQSKLNTILDGPFDQLPENFIEGETLRDAIVASEPKVRGKIDRLGNFNEGDARFLIHPYLPYESVADLGVFHRCMTSRAVPASDKPRCFVIDNEESMRPNPRPLALKRR